MSPRISRRQLVVGGPVAVGSLLLASSIRLPADLSNGELLEFGEGMTMRMQRLLLARRPLAREYTAADISAYFPPNGTTQPPGDEYAQLAATGFRDYRLRVGGLVNHSIELSIDELRELPARTQITQHLCDEGWTAIGQWTGVPVSRLLDLAGLMPAARYVVFHCLDRKDAAGNTYFESIDLFDAFHPQTILAYEMNGKPLPVAYGAPLRLRAELQIGYKNAKYIDRIEVVDSLSLVGNGGGSYWADRGYQWYVGM